jgi:hypothetical protein
VVCRIPGSFAGSRAGKNTHEGHEELEGHEEKLLFMFFTSFTIFMFVFFE